MAEYVYACPHCGKKLTLHLTLGAEKPAPKAPQRTLTPTKDLDADLAEAGVDALLVVADLEGALSYSFKKFQPGEEGRQVWIQVNDIMRKYGSKWIREGETSHWEVPTP